MNKKSKNLLKLRLNFNKLQKMKFKLEEIQKANF